MSSNNRIVFQGLDELREALRRLPYELRAEAGEIILSEAQGAEADILAGYAAHHFTGDLEGHVYVGTVNGGTFGAVAVVKSKAKHAWMFENGTQVRHTAIGADRGAMPPGHVFIPAMIRHRRGMYELLKDMVRRHGLTVA